MSVDTPEIWPWFAIAALGLFHGINPAMGWLFAVALGLQRGSRRVVLLSLAPIVAGHALAVAATLSAVVALGFVLDIHLVRRIAGAVLIAWAVWHALRGHRQPVRVGMQAGLGGLMLWSFMVSAAHGAGLMLVPALGPLCLTDSTAGLPPDGVIGTAAAAVSTHTAAMLIATAVMAILVYEWVGLACLRWAWINVDVIWVAALAFSGALLLVV